MKRFLTTTATALILSTSAYAYDQSSSFSEMTFDQSVNLNASELIGMRVYASEADINNETTLAADAEKEWDDIGEINEIVLTRDGTVQSVIVGVGGFLGLGEKDVAIEMDQLKFVSDGAQEDEFFLVVKASVAGVEEAPSYESGMEDKAMMNDSVKTKAEGQAMLDDKDTPMVMEPTQDRAILTAPEIDREGYTRVETAELTTEELTGAVVYGVNDQNVGEINKLLLSTDGELDRAVIDVGGFLGMGEHQVTLALDELNIVRGGEDSELRVYIDSTEEALKALPEYQS